MSQIQLTLFDHEQNALLENVPSYDRSLAWSIIFTFGQGLSCLFVPPPLSCSLGVFISIFR